MVNLKKSQIAKLETISNKILSLSKEFEIADISLNYGNGTVSEQLSIALAAIDTIYQEL